MVNSKLSEYELGNTVTSLSPSDKQPMVAAKKTALRDLQNDGRTVLAKPLGNCPSLKETQATKDAIKVLGNKRPTSDCPPSPPSHLSGSSNSPNGHLVYVRRKFEAELSKSGTFDKEHSADYPQSRQVSHKGDMPQQQTPMKLPTRTGFSASVPISMDSMLNSSKIPSAHFSLPKHDNGMSPEVTSAVPSSENSQDISHLHWKERFIHLQAYLKKCDHSNQEACIKMLQSLNSVERSRHAVELEKRAIRLLLEEGREMQRVKVLNVLGKSASRNNLSPLTLQVTAGQ
ncbi:hypothetical protein L1049_025171 [Liquidambar formosana]|uniref:Uncharacterized protein n=1 Tax=Liquidambar formosana TaxID=63359 RepID=A0AAP0WYZ0_LIQFO